MGERGNWDKNVQKAKKRKHTRDKNRGRGISDPQKKMSVILTDFDRLVKFTDKFFYFD